MPKNQTAPQPNSCLALWRKAIVADLAPLWILITFSVCAAFAVNQFRDHPLPLIYASKAERLQHEVDGLLSRDNAQPQSPQPAQTEASLPPASAQARQPEKGAKQPSEAQASATNNATPNVDTPTMNAAKSDAASAASDEATPAAQPAPFLDLEATRAIVEGKVSGLILDARPEIFHRLGHIPTALSLPREDFEPAWNQHRERIEKNKPHPLVVYCSGASCEDSLMVAAALQKLGLPNVHVFKGGWSDWTGAKLPEETTP